MKVTGYDGKTFTLLDLAGNEVEVGSPVMSFRGEDTTIIGGTAPHKPGSAGYVHTSLGQHYPSVYDLKWVEEN